MDIVNIIADIGMTLLFVVAILVVIFYFEEKGDI